MMIRNKRENGNNVCIGILWSFRKKWFCWQWTKNTNIGREVIFVYRNLVLWSHHVVLVNCVFDCYLSKREDIKICFVQMLRESEGNIITFPCLDESINPMSLYSHVYSCLCVCKNARVCFHDQIQKPFIIFLFLILRCHPWYRNVQFPSNPWNKERKSW